MRIGLCCAEDFNFGIGYLSAYLKQQGNEVKLFFFPYKEVEIEEIKRFSPDIVGISFVTANNTWAYTLGNILKRSIGCRIIMGGVHPTLNSEEVRELGFEPCVGDGIKYFGGEFDPDKIWCDREIFWEVLPPIHRKVQMFMTGFGCPFRCSYCNNHQLHKKIIRRDVKNCIKELICLKDEGMRYVLFDDDIFTIDKEWVIKFLHEYCYRVSLPFTCFGHPKYIDERICTMLKIAGCEMVWFGVQTGYEPLRREVLNRFETNYDIRKAVKLVKEHKMKVMIDHIFGIPTETRESIELSYELYRSLKPDVVNCYEMLYFPKAEINRYGKSQARYQKEGGKNFKRYSKRFISIPLGGTLFFLPTWVIKGIVYIKAKRLYIVRIVVENMVYFKWRALWKRIRSLSSLRVR